MRISAELLKSFKPIDEKKIDELTEKLWNALDANNKISLYVRYIDLATGESENRMINKNN